MDTDNRHQAQKPEMETQEGALPGEPGATGGSNKSATGHAQQEEVKRQGLLRAILDWLRNLFQGRSASPAPAETNDKLASGQQDPALAGADMSDPSDDITNDPTNNLNRKNNGQDGQEATWGDAGTTLVSQTSDHINDRFQGMMVEQAKTIYQAREGLFESMRGWAAGAGTNALSLDALDSARTIMKERLGEMEHGLSALQLTNQERQSELAKLEHKLDSPEALEAFDNASSFVDEQMDHKVRGVQQLVKEVEGQVMKFEEAIQSLPDQSNTFDQATLDPDNPRHPDYPQRKAALERFQEAMMNTPNDQGPSTQAGVIEGAQAALEAMDVPLPDNTLGR